MSPLLTITPPSVYLDVIWLFLKTVFVIVASPLLLITADFPFSFILFVNTLSAILSFPSLFVIAVSLKLCHPSDVSIV